APRPKPGGWDAHLSPPTRTTCSRPTSTSGSVTRPSASSRAARRGAQPAGTARTFDSSSALRQENAHGVDRQKRRQDEQRVDGHVRLSPGGVLLCALHPPDRLVAEQKEDDHRYPDEDGRDRAVEDDQRRFARVA